MSAKPVKARLAKDSRAARALCAAKAEARAAVVEQGRAERTWNGASKAHTRALERLTQIRSCHRCKRSECMAAARVRVLARTLQTAHARRDKAAVRVDKAAATLVRLGGKAPPRARASKPGRDGAPPRSKCGTVCHIQVRDGVCGGQAAVLLPSASGSPREVPTRYCLMEAEQLITSHDPSDFSPDPRYPPGTQERRYEQDRGEKAKVISIAQSPRPELVFSTSASPLDGTPIATVDGIVLGGNGRTMGMRRHYRDGGTVYSRYLLKVAHEFGFTPSQVRRFKQPIVVRTVDPPRDQWARYVRDLNQGLTQSLDPLAEGVSLARQMPLEALHVLADGLSGDLDLSDYFNARGSLPFVRALEAGGVITQQNRGRLLRSDGLLSDEGRALAIRQIGASILPDADLLELLGAGLRDTLARSAPYWLAAASQGGEWDVRPPLARAVRDLLAARAAELTVRKYFAQRGIFDAPHSWQHPMALRLLVLLERLGGKPAVFSKVARAFASDADLFGGRQSTLLTPRTPTQALDAAGAQAKLDLEKEVQVLL